MNNKDVFTFSQGVVQGRGEVVLKIKDIISTQIYDHQIETLHQKFNYHRAYNNLMGDLEKLTQGID